MILMLFSIWYLIGYFSYKQCVRLLQDARPDDFCLGLIFALCGPLVWLFYLSVRWDRANAGDQRFNLYQGLVSSGAISVNQYRQFVGGVN